MQICIDTREQRPLPFILDEVLTSTEKVCLAWGDYALKLGDGSLCPARFERKSIGDLYSSFTTGYKRVKEEFKRAARDGGCLLLIIEGTLTDVAMGFKYSHCSGRSLLRRLFSIWMHHDVMPIFCASPEEAAAFIKCFYEAWEKNMRKVEKVERTASEERSRSARPSDFAGCERADEGG